MYGMDSKLKLGDQLKNLEQTKKMGIYNLSSLLISQVLRNLAYQNRFQSQYNEISIIDRIVE